VIAGDSDRERFLRIVLAEADGHVVRRNPIAEAVARLVHERQIERLP
jgi:hypothetical protein